MQVYDTIYGNFEIDGVLEELLQTEAMQRLKKIHQVGASFLVKPEWNITRYEHSIGVMLLVKMLGGGEAEQIAALLHDVSHTAFSHVVDRVLHKKDEDYHEHIFDTVIENSDIPLILKKYGYDSKMLQNWEQWMLLEQPLPALCADRIDYTLRDLYTYGMISKQEVLTFLNQLIVHEKQICLSTLEAAEWFTTVYYKETIDFFLHPLGSYSYHVLTKVLQLALEKHLIHTEDFLCDDEVVLQKLKCCRDEEITSVLATLHPNVIVEENNQEYDICYSGGKERLIDPHVYMNGKIYKASRLSEHVRLCNQNAKENFNQNIYLKIKKA
ncbi:MULTISPECIES: HD domain-containing protein [Bacillus]|uniref:HD domain-containing protein n=1 Tax=Bacillus TaxID=1386 RepID=UPI0001A18FF9|nr:HD domain-containing protein [Bacillus pseudomycoides]EEM15283.1 Metal dependent phosphohydrolase [Bacillus pseudomycoides DSM 12442]MED1595176.1 HD domain-containing protein [Bacillus pseudomycoides]MED4709516.1 HD domain-containing protein [Bacillus pseudomycoides]OOR53616.1 HD domain-containing protein [Bacillus pseudomycoides]PDY12617.1 HD domain-containing protein [Bacillus pseudomycoides]